MKTQDSTIQLRINKQTKQKAQKTLESIGLDLTTAVKIFLIKVVNTGSIPFEIKTANGYTRDQEKILLKDSALALKGGKRFNSVKELMRDLYE